MPSTTTILHRFSLGSGMRRMLLAGLVGAAASLSACGGSGSDVDRGPTTLSVSADLNGLYWDKSESRLFLSDEKANTIRVWDGGSQFAQYAALPTAPASGSTLGQLTRSSDGSLYVTRFGFGLDGAVAVVPKSGNAYYLNGTDSVRRRIGITPTPDGALLDSWFIKGGVGAVSELKVHGRAATEAELITGFGKPVGLAVVGDTVYVSDQSSGKLLSYSLAKLRAAPATLADGIPVASFSPADGIDLMTAASDGTLFFGGSGGTLFRVNPKGESRVLASGWPKIRGVAYDERNRRLFVAVVAADAGSPSSVRIVPID